MKDKTKEELIEEISILQKRIVEFEILKTEHLSLRLLLDTVETIIVALDAEGKITTVNKKACKIFGYKENELIGQFWFSKCLPQPEGMKKVYPFFSKLILEETEPIKYFENYIITKNGELKLISWNNTLLRNEKDLVIGTLSSGDDITERKRIDNTLLVQKEFIDMAINSQIDTFFVFEISTGKAIHWNKAFKDITGYSDDEISSLKAPNSYYSSEDLKKADYALESIVRKSKGRVDLNLICKNGHKVFTEYEASIVPDKNGKPKYLVSVGRDLTEHRKLEEEKTKHLKELEIFYKASIGREERILELKKEIELLKNGTSYEKK